jgi:hypothetical protein
MAQETAHFIVARRKENKRGWGQNIAFKGTSPVT